jgi:hypothetical protein
MRGSIVCVHVETLQPLLTIYHPALCTTILSSRFPGCELRKGCGNPFRRMRRPHAGGRRRSWRFGQLAMGQPVCTRTPGRKDGVYTGTCPVQRGLWRWHGTRARETLRQTCAILLLLLLLLLYYHECCVCVCVCM